MIDNTPPEISKSQLCPRRIRTMYAALGTAPDETITPIIAAHWDGLTRQQILRQISRAEFELGIPANDNITVEWPGTVSHD